jgi:hypothetical protein
MALKQIKQMESKSKTLEDVKLYIKNNEKISNDLKSFSQSEALRTENAVLLYNNINRLIARSNSLFIEAQNLLKKGKEKEANITFEKGKEVQKAAINATIALTQSISAYEEKRENMIKALAIIPKTIFEGAVAFETVALCSMGQPWAGAAIGAASSFVFSNSVRETLGFDPITKGEYVVMAASIAPMGKIGKLLDELLTPENVRLYGPMYTTLARAIDDTRNVTPNLVKQIIRDALDACEDIAKLGGEQSLKNFRTGFRDGIEKLLNSNKIEASLNDIDQFLFRLRGWFSKGTGMKEQEIHGMLMRGQFEEIANKVKVTK